MRGTVAKRLKRTAQEAHLRANKLEKSSHVVVRLGRKAGTLLRRKTARRNLVERLVQGGFGSALAEIMVPAVDRYGLTVYNTGVRATYRFLKKEYKSGRVGDADGNP
jgi:hypothetical protein